MPDKGFMPRNAIGKHTTFMLVSGIANGIVDLLRDVDRGVEHWALSHVCTQTAVRWLQGRDWGHSGSPQFRITPPSHTRLVIIIERLRQHRFHRTSSDPLHEVESV